ncbi:myosin g [Cyclospora cayetanensis]|uniref:Myosin g n=1 Tax=Cyclospora cayetanensis TaxID=88456 RepID=A0A1D3CZV0_9EIME|nr:myosin g [Cyclospora cayetanensis]
MTARFDAVPGPDHLILCELTGSKGNLDPLGAYITYGVQGKHYFNEESPTFTVAAFLEPRETTGSKKTASAFPDRGPCHIAYPKRLCCRRFDSGAGKTETTKLILQFLAVAGGSEGSAGVNAETGSIQQRVLEANPVLEAFGNASTSRNPNSSRFGKWIEVIFNDKYSVVGARVTSYLLEVPRVVGHTEGERCYHVFYQILEGLKDSLKGLQGQYQLGTDPTAFSYLEPYIPSKTIKDSEALEELKHALQTLGFSASQQNNLFSIVAAILHLGNVKFIAHGAGGGEGSAPDPSTKTHISSSSSLLGVSEEGLVNLFIYRSLKTGNEVIRMVLSPEKAQAARDGIAQLVYSCLFSWLIARVNESLQPAQETLHVTIGLVLSFLVPLHINMRLTQSNKGNIVGILDIAGFESFKTNGFEQLCINLSNEKLQHHFNQDIFLNEMEDYQKDGLKDLKIDFVDNEDILDLIEGKGGIFAVLDEELFVPKGSEQGFVAKLAKNRASDKRLIPSKASGALAFSVNHYAGTVTYNAGCWLQKNQSALPAEAVQLLQASYNEIMAQAVGLVSANNASQAGGKGKSRSTVALEFKRQLKDLMGRIETTTTHYVRCIKPNKQHLPLNVCSEDILNQLICSGVMEAVRIRKAGFALRLPHSEFVSRYGVLMGRQAKTLKNMQPKQAAEALLNYIKSSMGLTSDSCLAGNSKVFCKDTVQEALESNRRQLRPFGEALGIAKQQGGSFLSPSAVFPDAPDALRLKQKAAELLSLVTQCESLGSSLEPPALATAKRALNKMTVEASLTLKLESELQSLVEDTSPLGELLIQTQAKGINNTTVEYAEQVFSRIQAEQELLTALAPAMESRDVASLSQLVSKAEQLKSQEALRVSGLSELVDCAVQFLAALASDSEKGRAPSLSTVEVEAFLTKISDKQKLQTARSAQREILKQTVESCAPLDARIRTSRMRSLMQGRESVSEKDKASKPVRVRPCFESLATSEWTESESEEETEYLQFLLGDRQAEAGVTGQEVWPQAVYAKKFLEELTQASAQCDAEALQFLLSRASEAGISPGQREVLIAHQQLRNFSDPQWLECELKECVILLSWGTISRGDITRLTNLIELAKTTPGVKQEALLSAEATQKAVTENDIGGVVQDEAAGFNSIENYPELSINMEIKKVKTEGLTEPLLPLPSPLDKEALLIFKKLQCLMGDRFSIGHSYGDEIIRTVLACEELKDEVYVQVLKQLRGNTNSKSVLKGYSFLATLCRDCPPSLSLERYVRQALEAHLGRPRSPGLLFPLDEDSRYTHPIPAAPEHTPAYQKQDSELQKFCADGLRALEANSSSARLQQPPQKKYRKSVFEFQVLLSDGSRRRVPLGLQASAAALCSATAAMLNIHNADEWISLVFRRPYLRLRENIAPHPLHSRLTCCQAVADFLNYPLEEPPEIIAEIAAKIGWCRASSQLPTGPPTTSPTAAATGSKWVKSIKENIPIRLQQLLPPHRWVALYEQHAAELDPDESEFLRMSSLLSSLKKLKAGKHYLQPGTGSTTGASSREGSIKQKNMKQLPCTQQCPAQEISDDFDSVFGGPFFLCDPLKLSLQHLLSVPRVFSEISAVAFGCTEEDGPSAADNTEARQEGLEALIDNSLHWAFVGQQQTSKGTATLIPRLLCPCSNRAKARHRRRTRRDKKRNGLYGGKTKTTPIEGICWLGFGEGQIVLEAESAFIEDDGDTGRVTQMDGLARSIRGKTLFTMPEELTGAFALDSVSSSFADVLILMLRTAAQGPRLCAFTTQDDARNVLQYLRTLYPRIAAPAEQLLPPTSALAPPTH